MPRPNSKPAVLHQEFREHLLDLLWSLWAELGVPGWNRRHQDWAVDPEPLLLFTALIGDSDPRLRDESIQWCVRNARYISTSRLRNLLRNWLPTLKDRWGPYAATVNLHGSVAWPNATEPLAFRPSQKSVQDDFKRPAIVSLRLRTTFGVSARSEILLYFVAHPDERVTAGELSEVVQYSKRNVEKELEALRKAGMLDVERRRNRSEHFVTQPESLLLFAGPRPAYFPRWDAIFNVLAALLKFEDQLDSNDATVAAIDARVLMRELAGGVQEARLPSLPEPRGRALPRALQDWGANVVDALAQSNATRLGWENAAPIGRPNDRTSLNEGVRTITSPLLPTATDLDVWAGTRVAQERMPELLRRLILATTDGITRIDMAAGEAVQYGGYDGVVEVASASPFVPSGRSVWEIGVSTDIKGKADSDYDKRTGEPKEIEPATTTFVFVTPRRWASKRVWERLHRENGPWSDVRVLDGDDLETWLALAPAVHAWLSALLGKSWGSIQDLRSYWADWSDATDPPAPVSLVLAGRRATADELRKRVLESATLVRVQGDSSEEALAFVAAALQEMERSDIILARSLVVHDPDGWNWAAAAPTPLVLIPRFEDPSTAIAIRHGHHVLIPVGREEATHEDLVIPRLRREAVMSALLEMGVEERQADHLATLGRASLTALRRKLAVDKGLERPPWAHRVEAPALLPALLAGAWDGAKPGDQEVLSRLADRPYSDLERSVARWAQASDAPVRKIGTTWFLVSKEDAWNLLATQLTPSDVARFRDALIRALGIQDPAVQLPPERRWMANVLGYGHPLSGHLREGLVDTLAIMGARSGEATYLSGQTGQLHADTIVRELLARANADDSGNLWASLAGVLPLLAEAAPEAFLDALDGALSRHGTPSLIPTLFTDTDEAAAIFSTSPHTGLLWALENLAWSPDYLNPAVRYLGTLARLDPRGKLANRPSSSLRSIFLIWYSQTAAPLRTRLDALDNLRRKEPRAAWDLMLAMLPRPHDIATPLHEPRWRDWKDGWREGATLEERSQAVQHVMSRLLIDAGTDGDRWANLVRHISSLPQRQLIEAVESLEPTSFSEEDRAILWAALRSEISNHRHFGDADWVLPEEALAQLEGVYERFAPSDPIQRQAWLFSQRPDLLTSEPGDWAARQQLVENVRENAVRSLREEGGLVALLNLASLAEQPGEVGRVIGQTAAGEAASEQAAILDLLDARDGPEGLLARGYVGGRFNVGGWAWATPILENAAPAWSRARRASFLSVLPFGAETWAWAQRFEEETERAYWSIVPAFWLEHPTATSVEQAANHLIRYQRAGAAVDLIGMAIERSRCDVAPVVVITALEELLRHGTADQWSRLGYEVAVLLEYLDRSDVIDMHDLAQLEWGYLPILQSGRRPPKVLHGELARNPEFFVDVLCTVFRPEGVEAHEPTDEERAKATLGYQLLDSWKQAPGTRPDGRISEEELNTWVDQTRALAADRRLARIADQQIGRVLRWLPDDSDGTWPNRLVRDLIERIESRDLETGLEIGLHNSRGATWRGLTEGGAQERALQAKYLTYAQQVSARWPRTAGMLRRLASSYLEEARMEDERAEITQDHWR